jgi:16S rRNA (cytosine967-C5)-methyltransferase
MRYQYYFNTALGLINQYHGNLPLVHYLKQYFADHKKHGSKDRKFITHLCYSYYRLGHILAELPDADRLRIILFILEDEPGVWDQVYDQSWLSHWPVLRAERLQILTQKYPGFSFASLFPWPGETSAGIDLLAFGTSYLQQPDLFIRLRPGREQKVLQLLDSAKLSYTQMGPACLALPNTTKLDALLDIDADAVIQDYSSQRIGEFLEPVAKAFVKPAGKHIWDCCAASGGKSILIHDLLGKNIELSVSDARPSILKNLEKRLDRAGIHPKRIFPADLTRPAGKEPYPQADLLVCDAPCSGSGTWGRTPEQLYHFAHDKILIYTTLQRKIVSTILPNIKPGGWFLYITCSVFREENEAVVAFIQEKDPSLQLEKMELLTGYTVHADTMFAALFRKQG